MLMKAIRKAMIKCLKCGYRLKLLELREVAATASEEHFEVVEDFIEAERVVGVCARALANQRVR